MPSTILTTTAVTMTLDAWDIPPEGTDPIGISVTHPNFGTLTLSGSGAVSGMDDLCSTLAVWRQEGTVDFDTIPADSLITKIELRRNNNYSYDIDILSGNGTVAIQMSPEPTLSINHSDGPGAVNIVGADSGQVEAIIFEDNVTPLTKDELIAQYSQQVVDINISTFLLQTPQFEDSSGSGAFSFGMSNWQMEVTYGAAPVEFDAAIVDAPDNERIPGNSIDIEGSGLEEVSEIHVSYEGEPVIGDDGELATPLITWILEPTPVVSCDLILDDMIITELTEEEITERGLTPGETYYLGLTFITVSDGLIKVCINYHWWTWIPDREIEITVICPSEPPASLGTITLPQISGVYQITHSALQVPQRHDSAYDHATGSMIDVRIANPRVKTGYIG